MGCDELLCVFAVLVSVGVVYGQGFQVPYGLRGFSQVQGGTSEQGSQQGSSDAVFILGDTNDLNLGSSGPFSGPSSDGTSRGLNLLPNTIGGDGQFPGSFSGATFQSNVIGGQRPTFQSNVIGGQRPVFQSFQRQTGFGSQSGVFQAQFRGDLGTSTGFSTGPVFQPQGPTFSGSRKVIEALPDVTLTRTVTQDRFVTTTDVAFVEQPRTATIFSFLTQTAVTTLVVPTPVDRTVVVSTVLVTRAPVTVTVTDVRSEFRYVTRTELQHITLTHTSYRFIQDTLVTTVTSVQAISTTVTRTDVNTITTTVSDKRTITSTVFPSYY